MWRGDEEAEKKEKIMIRRKGKEKEKGRRRKTRMIFEGIGEWKKRERGRGIEIRDVERGWEKLNLG